MWTAGRSLLTNSIAPLTQTASIAVVGTTHLAGGLEFVRRGRKEGKVVLSTGEAKPDL
jgi:hypothetical protein